ncbi:MAG: hypothetical protein WCK09_16100 [Bacteroidota bacterium]
MFGQRFHFHISTSSHHPIIPSAYQYEAAPANSTLNAIHLLKQAPLNSNTELTGAAAVSRLFANSIQHGYNRGYIEHHLSFLSGLCSKLPVFETGFTPDVGIVEFIRVSP